MIQRPDSIEKTVEILWLVVSGMDEESLIIIARETRSEVRELKGMMDAHIRDQVVLLLDKDKNIRVSSLHQLVVDNRIAIIALVLAAASIAVSFWLKT